METFFQYHRGIRYNIYKKLSMLYVFIQTIITFNLFLNIMNVITGERIQQGCDIYLGYIEDFHFNPLIKQQTGKHVYLNHLNSKFDNHYLVFCYSHRIAELSTKIHLFKNKFTLVTHNSDGEVRECDHVFKILECANLDKWYAQNLCLIHDKLFFLPIGIANSQWAHGNLELFYNNEFMKDREKTKRVYFHFNIDTNRTKRQPCYDALRGKLEWLQSVDPIHNLVRLKEYEFCICPEGNGVDTHRLWEALYLKTVPIVIKSEFTDTIKDKVPLVILDSWNDFDISKLDYSKYKFDKIINMNTIFS
jgi:hypothetical protein